MLKAKKIIRDLKHLKGNKIFGYYDAENQKESKNLEISPFDVIRALAPYEIDFKKRYEVDFDDVIYDDAQGNYDLIDLDYKECKNSYNWSSQIVFDYRVIRVTDNFEYSHDYIAIKFHRYGDVRGNYTDYMVLDMNIEQFYEVVMEASTVYCEIELNGNLYEISTNCFEEGCIFRVYCNDTSMDDDHVYLDIDNLRNKKDIKNALKQYLKELED